MKKIKLTDNALTVLTKRYYLKRDKDGRVTETPEQMFRRVSQAIAAAEKPYGGVKAVKDWAAKFYDAMSNLEFLPNSPTLMHAGTKFNQLSACFVLPLEDNLASIFKTMEEAATIARTGGGVGIPLSNLRARGTKVKSTGGVTSGPISFLQLFNQMANVINEGSSRRVAMMAVMNVHHPDIMDFIFAKGVEEEIKNFNISVGATDVFMKAVLANKDYELRSPGHTPGELGEVVKKISARRVMDMITFQAWKTADPGMVFLDRMNQQSPVNHLGLIETTNPCGEQPLLAYESCNLGSINLAKCLGAKGVNWEKIEALVRLGVRFLDDVIDICSYPLPEIDAMSKKTRKIGLGVMGLADLLVLLKIPYASNEALKLSERLANFNASLEA